MTTAPLTLERISVLATVDVLVCGSAGRGVALAARKCGVASVLLVERDGFLGGSSTQMLDTFYSFFTPGERPKKVVGRLPERVVDALGAASVGSDIRYDVNDLRPIFSRSLWP